MCEIDIASRVIADNHPILADILVEEVDVDVVHLDVVELVDVELVVDVVGSVNQGLCKSCVL